MIGISYDSVDILKRFARKANITFPLLSDVGSKTIDAYGIRNMESDNGVPYPGTFVIDAKGVIRAKLFLEGYRDRHGMDALIKAFQDLKK